jgi:hypothetical protein
MIDISLGAVKHKRHKQDTIFLQTTGGKDEPNIIPMRES